MELLQRVRSAFERAFISMMPADIDESHKFDVLVIHDDREVTEVKRVVYNNIVYGLIHRTAWNQIERTTQKPIGALDDPSLAKTLLSVPG